MSQQRRSRLCLTLLAEQMLSSLSDLKTWMALPPSDPRAIDYLLLLVMSAPPDEADALLLRAGAVDFADASSSGSAQKMVIYARGKDALTLRWCSLSLDVAMALTIVLLVLVPSLQRCILSSRAS